MTKKAAEITYKKYDGSKSGTGYYFFVNGEKFGYVSKFQDGTWMAYNGEYGIDSMSQETRKEAAEVLIKNVLEEREETRLVKLNLGAKG